MTTLLDLQTNIRDRFRAKSAWQDVADTEMVGQMSDLLGALFFETLSEVETARQDAFLSTATSRQAILAHASDRGYLPPRPQPPSGVVTITNTSTTNSITVPERFLLLDNEGVHYYTEEEVIIAPALAANVRVQQLTQELLPFYGNDTEYQEFSVSDYSLVDLSATVTETDALGTQTVSNMDQVPHFWNSGQNDWVYQLVYDVDDSYLIRLGNGEFGRKLTSVDLLNVEVWRTNPNHRLLAKAPLYAANTILDVNGIAVPIEVVVAQPIDGGILRANTERIRQEAREYRNLANRMVWRGDYAHVLKTELTDLGFVSVWGEAEQEAQLGKRDVSNINKIFISAHSIVDNTNLSLKVLGVLEGYPHPVGIKYQYVQSVPEPFVLQVRGRVPKGTSATAMQNQITNLLYQHYGINSPFRKESFLQAEAYALLRDSSVLVTVYDRQTAYGVEVQLVRGNSAPSMLQGFVHLDSILFDISS
jgi:hypothetical protein